MAGWHHRLDGHGFGCLGILDLSETGVLGDFCPSITNSGSLLKLMSIESVMPANHLILCCPLLLLPSVFPSIRVFSNESALQKVKSLSRVQLCLTLWTAAHQAPLSTGFSRQQEEKGTTEDEMVGWHHRLDGHESE